jgi:hypothetical protein
LVYLPDFGAANFSFGVMYTQLFNGDKIQGTPNRYLLDGLIMFFSRRE